MLAISFFFFSLSLRCVSGKLYLFLWTATHILSEGFSWLMANKYTLIWGLCTGTYIQMSVIWFLDLAEEKRASLKTMQIISQ